MAYTAHMQSEQSVILKFGFCSLDPEVLHIIQLMFSSPFIENVVFHFHFYIYLDEIAKGECFGPKWAFLLRRKIS